MDLPKEKVNPMDITKKLLEEEEKTSRKIAEDYREKITGMAEAIRELLIGKNFKIKDWYAVVEYMDKIQSNIVSTITFKELYDQGNTKDTESEHSESDKQDVGGGQGEAPKEE